MGSPTTTPARRPGWYPPLNLVEITRPTTDRDAGQIMCSVCDTVTRSRVTVLSQLWHRCPAGTPGAKPACPTCYATRDDCVLLDGRPAPEWHPDRTAIYTAVTGARP